MLAYAIAQINITNINEYKEYLSRVTSIVKKYNGEYLVRGGRSKVLLGKWDYERTVIIKFRSYDDALKWYNSKEYEPVKKIREENSNGNFMIIEGI